MAKKPTSEAMALHHRITDTLRNLIATPSEKGTKQAVMLAVASSKGGVGKTTTSVNLAMAFARMHLQVLLLDLDPQAHVAAALQLAPTLRQGQLGDVLLGRLRDIAEVATTTRWSNLYSAGSDKTLAETEMVLSAKIGKEMLLDQASSIARSRYDVIIIDCPPNLGTLTLNALCAADYLLIPADASILALEGVADITSTVCTLQQRLARKLEICGIVITRFDKRATHMNQRIVASFVDLYGDCLLTTHIPQTSSMNKAHMAGESIFDYAPHSPGAQAYANLANELLPRLGIHHVQAQTASA